MSLFLLFLWSKDKTHYFNSGLQNNDDHVSSLFVAKLSQLNQLAGC